MPIIKSLKRKNPFDLNKSVTIGTALPLNEVNFFKGTETMAEQNKTNLINLLLTEPFERINLPNYGVGIRNLLFEQNLNQDLLQEKIFQQTSRYIPTIKVIQVKTGLSEDKHTLYLNVIYKSLLDNSLDNIQLNFN